MSREAIDELKRQIPLLDYLQANGWIPTRRLNRSRSMGLCPLHRDRKPSFLVDSGKGLFYCYGCGRGGDVIRFVELCYRISFAQALALLQKGRGPSCLLDATARFYHDQLRHSGEAVAYLQQRGNRSISASAPPHRFLPGAKGGLYAWEQVRRSPEIILVEGLFDYAVLWQAGFRNVTCSMGTHLNARQLQQLCDYNRTVYLTFDADSNGSGQHAAESLAGRLMARGLTARQVVLPDGHDPNSFFVEGGDARQFHLLVEAARP